MKNLEIVSNNTINKDVFLNGKMINILDFGNLIRSNIVTKGSNISEMEFKRYQPKKEIMEKYNLNYKEYNKLCDALETEIKSYLF